jgi:thioredoxin 1
MAATSPVTDSTFDAEVLNAEKPVLVDFWAAWCGPCRMVAPVVEELAKDYRDQLSVRKLDVDENINVAAQYQVQSIPTLILFKDGKPAQRIVGYMPKERLLAQLKPHPGERCSAERSLMAQPFRRRSSDSGERHNARWN